MGKKHKKHHKSERRDYEDDDEHSHSEMVVEEKCEKPLKLVLKVGGSQTNVGGSDTPVYSAEESYDYHEKRRKHKKKKKKKNSEKEKHRHGEHGEEKKEKKREKHSRDSEAEEHYEPPAKKTMYEDDSLEKRHTLRLPPRGQPERLDDTVLYDCLDYLHKTIQRKDANAFFAYPVNDVIAPGYSSIITEPMDLSTMRSKLDNGDYSNVLEYKRDFKLMCDNAMTYNHQETIYYKAAKKLLHQGIKMMSKDRLINMKRTLPFMINITDEELGLDEDDTADQIVLAEAKENKKKLKASLSTANSFEAAGDDMTPNEILESAQAAAKSASDKLTLRNPNSHIGFLRRQKDGSTSLQILNPENSGMVSETEKIVSLGSLVGKLNTGTGGIPTFKEDRRNIVKPVTYLNYGPYGTYCPTYDSSFSTITKEESDLILQTYGDETSTEYATSIQDFLEDCNTGADIVRMVDNLLDIVTGGEHKKTKKIFEDRQKETEEKRKHEEKEKEEKKKSETEKDRKSPTLKEETSADSEDKEVSFQKKLDETAGLIGQLQKSQYDRLGQKLPSHLAYVPGPSASESQLAEKVSKGLTELTKEVKPEDVVSQAGVRKALGITMEPVEQSPVEQSPAPSEDSHDLSPVEMNPLSVSVSDAGSKQQSVSDAGSVSNPASISGLVSPQDQIMDELEDFAQSPAVLIAMKSPVGMEVEEEDDDEDSVEDSGDEDDDDDDDDDDSGADDKEGEDTKASAN
ncbi:bromodomain-containing protein 7-like [Lineus longissimus]|uniref:bromodomain-containing protein 7-like n=1 Tax=Lineus longissimus TaxID=88925 RepID=UPI002B4E4C84